MRKRLPGRERFRVSWEERPYFPRYLFCRASERQIARVYGLGDVVTVLGSGGLPKPLPDAAMQIIIDIADGSGQIGAAEDTTRKGHGFTGKEGDAVRFAEGDMWEHVSARITSLAKLDSKGRVDVLLSLFGQTSKASVEVGRLRVEV